MSGTNGVNRASSLATIAAVVFGGAMGFLALWAQPIRNEVHGHDSRIAALEDVIAGLKAKHDALPETLREVETQFAMQSKLTNTRYEAHDRMIRMVWERVYEQDMPGLDYWPEVGDQQ